MGNVLPVVIAAIAGSIAAFFASRAIMRRWPRRGKWGINTNPVSCPQCQTPQSRSFRWPTSWRQAMWGGWTCKKCGCEMDKYGNKVP